MARKPTYEELQQRVRELEKETLERERAEKTLHDDQVELTTILENAPIMMMLVDRDGRVTKVNSAVVQFAGRPAEEIMGLPGGEVLRCLHSLDDPRGCGFGPFCETCTVRRIVMDTMETGKNHHRMEATLPFECGGKQEERTFYLSLAPITTPKKQLVLVCIEDITERRRAEMALRKAHAELEGRVEERTAQLRDLSSKLLVAQEEESKRIGQELHDGLAQTLSAIKVWVEVAHMQLGQKNLTATARSLESVVPLTQEAVEETRRIAKNLRPSILDDLGIVATISWLCQEFETIYSDIGIEKEVEVKETDVPDSLKIVIFRVLQEALNNIAKHSRANLVRLSLKRIDHDIELTIDDNGEGFDVEHVLSGELSNRGFGLTSMRERATLSGGSFSIESHKGAGTRVRASWELENISKDHFGTISAL